MLRLFKKKSLGNLKRLKVIPTQYLKLNLKSVMLSSEEISKNFILRKLKGLSHFNDLFFQVELIEYRGDSCFQLSLISNLVVESEVEKFINQFYKVLGIDENGEGKYNSKELLEIDNLENFQLRIWEISENEMHYSVQIDLNKMEELFQIEVHSLMHDL